MKRTFTLVAALCLLALTAATGAMSWRASRSSAASPAVQDIASGGPLEHIYVSDDLSCQVGQANVPANALFPASIAPADCGTFLGVGFTLYAPNFFNHDGTGTIALGGYTPFTPVSQSGVTGSGTAGDPYRVITVADAGANLRVTETTTYVAGEDAYRTDIEVRNLGSGTAAVVLYRAADCQLAGSNFGYGVLNAVTGAVGCAATPNNAPAAQTAVWTPLTPADSYFEGAASTLWSTINAKADLPETCQCGASHDNAAGLSWRRSIPAGEAVTMSHLTSFAPVAALAVTKTVDPPAVTPGAVVTYEIHVDNPNAFDIALEQIEDTLPSGFAYVDGTTSGVTTWDPWVSGSTLNWSGNWSVPALGSVTLRFSATASSLPGVYLNSASAVSPAAEAIPAVDVAPVTVGGTPTPTPSATATAEATATSTPTHTSTPAPPTATHTATATDTAVPPTATHTPTTTPTHTSTPVPPTATHTATATPTQTPVPPTATHTATATSTPVPPTNTPTATPTHTAVPPTATHTATNTPVPTATDTATVGSGATATATPTLRECADVNGDGRVTFGDVLAVVRHLGKKRFDPRYDVNGDGRITGADVVLVIRQLGKTC